VNRLAALLQEVKSGLQVLSWLSIVSDFDKKQGALSVQVSIAVRHGHLGEASQDKLKAKAEKLARIFDRLMSIEVIVDLSNEQSPEVDIKVSAEHKHDFVAHSKSESLMGAFDSSIQKIEQQLRKYKERVQERHRNSQSRRQEVVPAEDEVEDVEPTRPE